MSDFGQTCGLLALNILMHETQEGIAAFNEKRAVDYEGVRRELK